MQCIFVDSVERFGSSRLQVDIDIARPAARVVGFGQRDTLTDKTAGAVKKFCGLSDRQEGLAFKHLPCKWGWLSNDNELLARCKG